MSIRSIVFVILLGLMGTAQAQDINAQPVEQDPIRYPGLNQGDTTPGTPALPQDLELTVAVGAGWQPEYMGSDDHELIFEPAIDAEYKQRAFFVVDREAMMVPYDGLGMKFFANQDFSAGVNLTYDPGRDDDNAFITGIGDMDWTALANVFAVYHPGPLFIRGQLGYDLLDEFNGFKGEIGAGASAPFTAHLRGFFDTTAYFSGENYQEDYFGVPGGTASGLPAYDPDGGFYKWRMAGALQYQMTPGAFLEGVLRYDHLMGDAQDSPISNDDNTFTLSGMVGYKF